LYGTIDQRSYRKLKGGKDAARATLKAFKQEAEIRCLLLNLKSGAKGLTLVEVRKRAV
jgi:SNF2 family DNA or RNA helicase